MNARNQVLLDSLTVESARVAADAGTEKLYCVTLVSSERGVSGGDIYFYMKSNGKAYYRNLRGDRKSNRKK